MLKHTATAGHRSAIESVVPSNPAERAFALIKTLDAQHSMKKPTLVTTFRLYCIENMSAADIAERFGISTASIINRLSLIRTTTGIDPEHLRRLSPHISKLEDSSLDSRAPHLHRQRLIGDAPEDDYFG